MTESAEDRARRSRKVFEKATGAHHKGRLDEAIAGYVKALEIDPAHDNAMAYINLLYRELADISETKEDYEKYTAMANEWSVKSLDTRKKKAEAATAETFQDES